MAEPLIAEQDSRPPLAPGLGVLLVGHGTRNRQGQAEFLALADLVAQALPSTPVQPCFLELAEPNITSAVVALAARGVTSMVVAPCLLFTAGHAKEDIPRAVQAAANLHDLSLTMAETLGVGPLVVEASQQVCRVELKHAEPLPREQTCFILAGRGSSDAEAQAALHAFAAARNESTEFPVDKVAFMAAALPTLAEVLADLPSPATVSRLIVQPHLLFQGRVIEQIDEALADWKARRDRSQGHVEVIRLPHLGPQPALAKALIVRIYQAGCGREAGGDPFRS